MSYPVSGSGGRGQCRTVQFDAVKVSCVQVLSPSVVPGIGIAISRVLSFRQNIIRGEMPRNIFYSLRRFYIMTKDTAIKLLKQIDEPIIIDSGDDKLSSNLSMKRLSVTINESKNYKHYSNKEKKLIRRVRDIMIDHNQFDAKYELDLVIDYFTDTEKRSAKKNKQKKSVISIEEFVVELELLIPNSFNGKNVYICRVNNDIKISVDDLLDIIIRDGHFTEYKITTSSAKVIYDDKLIKSFKSIVVHALRQIRGKYDIVNI